MLLITHDGTFHADDVLAFVILNETFAENDPVLVRTRDAKVIESAEDAIVFDVGNVYDSAINRFDHHQRDKAYRENGVPYSSVGLIWSHFGDRLLRQRDPSVDDATIARIWARIDSQIIAVIDAVDNGVEKPSPEGFVQLIDGFNPAWDEEPGKFDRDFLEAAEFATKAFDRIVLKAFSTERAAGLVTEAARNADDPRLVELPTSMPWEGALLKGGFDEALYVIYPRSGTEWLCVAVPPERGSYEQRLPLPEAWAALRDGELAAVSGVADAIFCHSERFICGARSREGAKALANEAIRLGTAIPAP